MRIETLYLYHLVFEFIGEGGLSQLGLRELRESLCDGSPLVSLFFSGCLRGLSFLGITILYPFRVTTSVQLFPLVENTKVSEALDRDHGSF